MSNQTKTFNGYTYTVDTEKGHTTASGKIQDEKAERDAYLQAKIGKESGESHFDGGHLIGSAENGISDSINIHSQARDLNRGSYKTIETSERNLVTNDDASIETDKTAFMIEGSRVPSAYIVNDRIVKEDGTEDDVHLSYTNLNKNEMQEIQDEAERSGYYDELSDSSFDGHGLSDEDIDEIMESGEKYLSTKEQFSDDWETFQIEDERMEESDLCDDENSDTNAEVSDYSEGNIS